MYRFRPLCALIPAGVCLECPDGDLRVLFFDGKEGNWLLFDTGAALF